MESQAARGSSEDDGREREDHLRGAPQGPEEATSGEHGPGDRLHQERYPGLHQQRVQMGRGQLCGEEHCDSDGRDIHSLRSSRSGSHHGRLELPNYAVSRAAR